jgi:hypothetical protein
MQEDAEVRYYQTEKIIEVNVCNLFQTDILYIFLKISEITHLFPFMPQAD